MRRLSSVLCVSAGFLIGAENPDRLFETNNQRFSTARAKELLAVVCPGHVVRERTVSGDSYGCDACPDADSDGKPSKLVWTLESFLEGHFYCGGR